MIVGLSACGGGDDSLEGLSAQEVLERVQADMETVSSLRISGAVEGGDAFRDLDLALDDDGNYEGTFSIDDVPADILIVDDRLFVRGGERFWTETGLAADSQMARPFAGQWVGTACPTRQRGRRYVQPGVLHVRLAQRARDHRRRLACRTRAGRRPQRHL